MIRTFAMIVAVAICLAAAAKHAHALGADLSDKDIAAVKHCVHGYWVNMTTVMYFRGDVAAFNANVITADESGTPITWASRRVVLHVGPKMAGSPWDKKPRNIPADWQVTTWFGDDPPAGDGSLPMNRQIDVWLGANLKLDDLQIPADYEVVSGGEIEAFLAKRKKAE